MRKVWVLMSLPGAGKGTVKPHLTRELRAKSFSTGDYLLQLRESGGLTPEQEELYDSGNRFPDEQMTELITKFVQSTDSDLIFDGFPRTLAQAEALTGVLEQNGLELALVWYLEATDELLVTRVLSRRVCASCQYPLTGGTVGCFECGSADSIQKGTDTNEAKIRARLADYHEVLGPVVEYYGDKVIVINADRPIEAVIFDILNHT